MGAGPFYSSAYFSYGFTLQCFLDVDDSDNGYIYIVSDIHFPIKHKENSSSKI
jgi:hypothetical protein